MAENKVQFDSSTYLGKNWIHLWRAFEIFSRNYQLIANLPAPATALDLACGPGNITQMLRNFPNIKRIYGVDFSENMIEAAKKNHQDSHLTFHVTDACKWDTFPTGVEKSCDLVTSFSALHWVPDFDQAVRNMHRCMKSDANSAMIFTLLSKESIDALQETPFMKWFQHATSEKWSPHFEKVGKKDPIFMDGFLRSKSQPNVDHVKNLLLSLGLKINVCEVVKHQKQMSKQEYYDFVELCMPSVRHFSANLRANFLEECIAQADFDACGLIEVKHRFLYAVALN